MYLTRIHLDPYNQTIREWLRNPYQIHQRLWMGIPENVQHEHKSFSGATPPFLYRIENQPRLRMLVQSLHAIDWGIVFAGNKLCQMQPAPDDIKILKPDKFIHAGRIYRFSLLANPTRKRIFPDSSISRKVKIHQQGWKKSKKVGAYSENEQMEWLFKRGKSGGFRLKSAIVENTGVISAAKRQAGGGGEIRKIFTVAYAGLLEITEAEIFAKTHERGIGSAKAFGCGLLLLAPV